MRHAGSRHPRRWAATTRVLLTWALLAAAAWFADGGRALASPPAAPARDGAAGAGSGRCTGVAPAHGAAIERGVDIGLEPGARATADPAGPRVRHASAEPGRTLVRPARVRHHLRLHVRHAPRPDAARTLARAERRPAPAHPRDHGAPPPPPAPSQVSFHRHGPDSRGQGIGLPPAMAPRAATGEATARGEFGRARAIGMAPVREGRGPPAITAAGIARVRPVRSDRPARPAPHSAPHLAATRPATLMPPPFATTPGHTRRATDAGAVVSVASQEPRGSRAGRPGGGAGAFHPPSAGESS